MPYTRPAFARLACWTLASVLAIPLTAAPATARAAAATAPASPVLKARPIAGVADSLPPGRTELGDGTIAYRPGRLAPGLHSLVVLLHGGDASADDLLNEFKSQADAGGLILLAPQAAAATWDLLQDAERFRGRFAEGGERPHYGPDVARIDAALAKLFGKVPIDPRRIVLAGFSDGASYALSLGLNNPQLFPGVIALSPGLMVASKAADARQRLFIAHGINDREIPAKVSREGFVPALKAAGMTVRYREFSGGHKIDSKALKEGLAFALGEAGQ